ncbi:MAG TPA: LUD domain-containing protein [Acidobacteriota bacterium]|nr:LUD domain-containing protein [Acidobacteriota bacterium]
MKDAKAEILARIRRGLGESPQTEPLPAPLDPALSVEDLEEAFRKAVEGLGGSWHAAEDPIQALKAVQSLTEKEEANLCLLSRHPLVERVVNSGPLEISCVRAGQAADMEDLERADIGLAAATWGAASTGTLILSAADEGTRIASLSPPVSIVLLPASGLCSDLSEFFDHQSAETARNSALTLVSGPSRTGDIELTLSTGVHGPGVLHVILCRFQSQTGPATEQEPL